MRSAIVTVIAAAVLSSWTLVPPRPARAEAPPTGASVTIQGTWGFDWLKPKKSRCAQVTGALLATLQKKYTCGPSDSGTASGAKIAASCKANKGESEYLLFASAKECKDERETQLANAP